MQKTILSIFDFSGVWSKFYKENGYNVIQADIKLTTYPNNIYQITEEYLNNISPIYGVLAAPPCTAFSGAGARWWKRQDLDGTTKECIDLAKKTLEIINCCKPTFWAVENPVGRLNKMVPEYKEHGPRYFQPFWYGEPYSKKTGLWGSFNFPQPNNVVKPEGQRPGQPPAWYSKMGGKSEKTKEYRSKTPVGFAKRFFEFNQ